MTVRIFGAALDVLDDPDRVDMKLAYIDALVNGRLTRKLPADPYEAVIPLLGALMGDEVSLHGKLDIPSWLTSRPKSEDAALVTPEKYAEFLDRNEIARYVDACAAMVSESILPDVPCMIAVDHAMTAGPVKSLARLHGPENLALLIVDSHFDAIPARLRAPEHAQGPDCGAGNCGSFIAALIDEGIALPENIIVAGVTDYPVNGAPPAYREAYMSLVESGVSVIPADNNMAVFLEKVRDKLFRIGASKLYVSLDTDAGACVCMNAVRFLDHEGLDRDTILGLARLARRLIDDGKFELAGADVTEMDVHMLGLIDPNGLPDRTEHVCAEFLTLLFGAAK